MSNGKYHSTWSSLDTRPIPPWFQNAKFGIFVHWGPYSVPAYRKLAPGRFESYAEWYYASVMYDCENGGREFHQANYGKDFQYRDFGPLFRAELFSAKNWASLFRKAGAKYVVLTTKHHDGYCLWPTESTSKINWNSMNVGPGKDLVGELSTAVTAEGLRMGLYYSIIEWESCETGRTESGYYLPDSIVQKHGMAEEEYVAHMNFQLRELVSNYKPSLIFADGGEWDLLSEHWKTKEFLAWLYNSSPVKGEVVVNDRFSKDMPGAHGDYYSSEYNDVQRDVSGRPWEESRGIGESYGLNRAESIENYSTSEELINELIDIVSRGGNLLLNVGPEADGRIPVIMQERLLDIGKWLEVNGEAVYETTRRDVTKEESLRFTIKGNQLFCLFSDWVDVIEIKLLENEHPCNVSLIGYQCKLEWKVAGTDKLSVNLPKLTVTEVPCHYAWVLRVDLK